MSAESDEQAAHAAAAAKFAAFSGFYKRPITERRAMIQEFLALSDEEMSAFDGDKGLSLRLAGQMVENVFGVAKLPMGVGLNFVINGVPRLIPMVVEEPSVVAAASYAAKLSSGFKTSSDGSNMIGQIQILNVPEDQIEAATKRVLAAKEKLIVVMNEQDPVLIKFGGGAVDLEVRDIRSDIGPMLIVHTIINVGDSMGANVVNTMNESIATRLEELTGGVVKLRIISNLAIRRLCRASTVWKKELIGGEGVVDGIIMAYHFANADPFRCATHNKGVMNGVDAVVHATGNDWRAVEAGAHAWAAYRGKYEPLTKYSKDKDGNLVGSIEMPMPVGIVGGCTRTHPTARTAIQMTGVKTACELGEIIVSVGLAQNFAALRALATEGIQRGHMRLARRAAEMLEAEDGKAK